MGRCIAEGVIGWFHEQMPHRGPQRDSGILQSSGGRELERRNHYTNDPVQMHRFNVQWVSYAVVAMLPPKRCTKYRIREAWKESHR